MGFFITELSLIQQHASLFALEEVLLKVLYRYNNHGINFGIHLM